jgi:hypothetical protein
MNVDDELPTGVGKCDQTIRLLDDKPLEIPSPICHAALLGSI